MYQCVYRQNYRYSRCAVSRMARREQSQFDDAFEDAESDLVSSKAPPITSHSTVLQRNGHLSPGWEEEHNGTNGELPESETAEEDVMEERTEDGWNEPPEQEEAAERGMDNEYAVPPDEDGSDEYGDAFFIDQNNTGTMEYNNTYQYIEGDDYTREGTEDSGQGQMRDDLTESDKDKDYLDDATHEEHRDMNYDRDDHYEDSGVVDDNGIVEVEGEMHGYEAEEDHVEGEDRFEEVDIRYSYLGGNSYSDNHPYVEDNPAYNEHEQDYEIEQVQQREDIYQDYTESDLPETGPTHIDNVKDEPLARNDYGNEQTGADSLLSGYNADARLGDSPQMTGDYVIVDKDVLAPTMDSKYAASDSVEADQEEESLVPEEDFESRNSDVKNQRYEAPLSVQSFDNSYNRSHESDAYLSSAVDSVPKTHKESSKSDVLSLNLQEIQTESSYLTQESERRVASKSPNQPRISPKALGSPVRGVKDSRSQVPRRPGQGAAQGMHKSPVPLGNKTSGQSPKRKVPAAVQGKAPRSAGNSDSDERYADESEVLKRCSPRPASASSESDKETKGNQERRVKGQGLTRPTSGERPKNMPLPGGAQPVSVLKSRLREELREMYEIEKNLASTTIQPEVNRTQNTSQVRRAGAPRHSPKEGSLSSRHNDEYASVSSLRNSPAAQTKTSPTHRSKYGQEPVPSKMMSRSPSSSPEKMKASRSAEREQPRNNSNANHLGRDGVTRRPQNHNSRTQDHSKRYSYEIEEKSDTASGEVVFDDIAECGAYLDEKETRPSPIKIKNRQAKSPVTPDDDVGGRRRRNSYEIANRSSSEDELDESEALFDANREDEKKVKQEQDLGLPPFDNQKGGLLGNGARGRGMNSNLLAQLAERELANLWNSYKKPQEEPTDGHQGSQSAASDTSSTSSTPADNQRKVLPNLSPMEYDAVGFRLAGHAGIGESTLNLSAVQQAHPEEDQFSDAEEDGSEPGNTPRGNPILTPRESFEREYPSPTYNRQPSDDYRDRRTSPSTALPHQHQPEAVPEDPVDVDVAMKELHSALSNSKTKLMKAPSFYTPEQKPIWILQPDAAKKHEEDQKRSRVLEDRRRRNEEMRRSHFQQRAEYMKRTDPDCYVRKEEDEEGEDEDKGLISDQEQKAGAPSYFNKQRLSREPETMRAPDLPPTTGKIREARGPHDETALGRGIIYPAAYLGSTQLVTTKQPTKKVRMQQAQEAVNRIKTRLRKRWYKSPDGEEQPSTEVDLAISNERIRVLNADTQETMMDHPLKTISYIADIGNIVVIMARRRNITRTLDEAMEDSGIMVDAEGRRQPRKIICHVFETEDAQLIAQTIGQAFALAYLEFLKANGIEDPHAQEIDYHDVLNSQEIYGDDLMLFSNKECEKEVLVEKERGEIMGMVIVESGWGSLIPTVVIANMSPFGAAARSGKLNIGDQVMSINGTSLVGLPLQQCQQIIKSLKSQCLVKFNVVSCPPVTQVLIKRPDTKYQLGFSVQNGIICSLMRGGIAERGGVRVGHRIIEINGSSVVATAHEKIVEMLSTSVGEIRMKTMPLSMYKLLTGQEQPVYI